MGWDMKKVLLWLAPVVIMVNTLSVKAATMTDMAVTYVYYNTAGEYVNYRNEHFDDFNTAKIDLFQIAVDDMAQRSDGYLYECKTNIWLDGVTNKNSISIRFGNPCVFNEEVESANMTNPYNMLKITLYMADNTIVDFVGVGGKNDMGNISTVELANYGTCEMSDEIVVSLIKGVAVDRVEIAVRYFADLKEPPYRPMSWWGNGSLELGEYDRVSELVELLDKKVEQIVTPTVIDQNKANQMESGVADNKEQSDQLLEDSKVEKPTVPDEVLDPMDKVEDDALDSMGGMIGAVFVSPTLGSIAILTLTFALLGYILYGKR